MALPALGSLLSGALGVLQTVGSALFGPAEGNRPQDLAVQVQAQQTAPVIYQQVPYTTAPAPGTQPASGGANWTRYLPWALGGLVVVVGLVLVLRR